MDRNNIINRGIISGMDLNNLVPGEVLYTKTFSHVWVYIGRYGDMEHACVDVARVKNSDPAKRRSGADFVDLASLLSDSKPYATPYYHGKLKWVDYSSISDFLVSNR